MKILVLVLFVALTGYSSIDAQYTQNVRVPQRKTYYNMPPQVQQQQGIRKKWQNYRQTPVSNSPMRRPIYPGPPQRNRLGVQFNNAKSPLGPPKPYPNSARLGTYNKLSWNANNYARNTKEKPFQTSPKIVADDYHLQTNQIPNHVNLVKQLDEKGPIHTIPAPNLSPADKPKNIDLILSQQQQQQHQQQKQKYEKHSMNVQQKAQYQVSETPSEYQQQTGYTLLPVSVPEPIPYTVLRQPEAGYQTVLLQPQFIKQSDLGFLAPEMQSFNYQEPNNDDASASASNQFVLQSDDEDEENDDDNEELITGTFYSSLPSKKAADTLAELYANGNKQSESDVGDDDAMRIYVPDDSEEVDKREVFQEYGKQQAEVLSDGFGGRIQRKN